MKPLIITSEDENSVFTTFAEIGSGRYSGIYHVGGRTVNDVLKWENDESEKPYIPDFTKKLDYSDDNDGCLNIHAKEKRFILFPCKKMMHFMCQKEVNLI